MRKTVLGLIVGSMVFSAAAFAAPAPKLPGQVEYSALMKKQSEARKALGEQQMAERNAFLKNYPELSASVAAQEQAAKERAAKRKAEGK